MKKQHHGEILEQAIRQSSISITKVAKKTGYTRQHLYNLFKQDIIDLNIILLIGEFIHHDFSDTIHQLKKYKNLQLAEIATLNGTQMSFEQKYYELLKEHNQLLRKYTKLVEKKI